MLVETKPLRKFAPGDQLAAAADQLKEEKPAPNPAAAGQPAAEAAKPEKPGGNN
jgi:hypothetical protein